MMGAANVKLLDEPADVAAALSEIPSISCSTFPTAKAFIYYENPGFIVAYFNNGGVFYTFESFSASAETGNAPEPSTLPAGGVSYPVGGAG